MHARVLLLGILPEMDRASPAVLAMQSGDMALLITDGFFVWENPAQEQFGTERLAEVLREFSDCEPEIIIAELYDAVLNLSRGRRRKTKPRPGTDLIPAIS